MVDLTLGEHIMNVIDYHIQPIGYSQLVNIEAAMAALPDNSAATHITDVSAIGRALMHHIGPRWRYTHKEFNELLLVLANSIKSMVNMTITFSAPTGPWEIKTLNLCTNPRTMKLELIIVLPDGTRINANERPSERYYGEIIEAIIATPRYVLATIPSESWFLLADWDDLVTAHFKNVEPNISLEDKNA